MPVCPDCQSTVADIVKPQGHDRSCVGILREEIRIAVMKLLPHVLTEHGYGPPAIEAIFVSSSTLSIVVRLFDGRALIVETKHFERLSKATYEQLKNYELLGIGGGVHWPDLDEDISIRGFLRYGTWASSPLPFDSQPLNGDVSGLSATTKVDVNARPSLANLAPPLSQMRCTTCGELWAEPIEYYRHVHVPFDADGKCRETASGPPVRLLMHHAVEALVLARRELLGIGRRHQDLEATMITTSVIVGLSRAISDLGIYARDCEPTDVQQEIDGIVALDNLRARARGEK